MPLSAVAIAPVILSILMHAAVEGQGPPDRCWCFVARLTDGWCQQHHCGFFAGVRMKSRALYDSLDAHGHEVRASMTRCQRCRDLIETGGYCKECHMGYRRGAGFFGRLGYHTAAGVRIDADFARAVARFAGGFDGAGWCRGRGMGLIGNRAFFNHREFAAARKYTSVLRAAVQRSMSCEDCAMAMVADARCPFCRVEYFEGSPVKEK